MRDDKDILFEEIFGQMLIWVFKIIGYIIQFSVLNMIRGFIKLRYYKISDSIHILLSIFIPLTVLNRYDIDIWIKSLICIISLIFISGIVFSIEKLWVLNAFYKAGLIPENGRKLKFYYLRSNGDLKVCCIGMTIPHDKIISKLTFLSKMLNYNIIDINVKSKFKFGYQEMILSKQLAMPSKYILLERLYYTLFYIIDDIKHLEYKEELTRFIVTFDSKKSYKTVKLIEDELIHRCKKSEGDILIKSHFLRDYQIVIKKDVKFENDFLKLFENNKSSVKSKSIPWIAGYKENSGQLNIFDLREFIHLIIAGASGNGKSNLIHTILLSILLSDAEIEIVICDPKRNEFKAYRNLKNIKYYNDFDSIVKAIKENVREMNRRNKVIEPEEYIRDIEGYNRKHTVNQIKYRIIVIDEIADLILNPDKSLVDEFSDNLSKLAQLSRSVGMRLLLSTQNPTKDVLKKFIKANIQTRAALGTSNKTDSRTILDNNMASEIDLPGKFVLQLNKENSFYYSPYIPDKSLVEILNYIKQHSHVWGENKNKTLELINDSIALREKFLRGERVEIDNSKHLYKFYINLNLTNNILPVKKEIQDITGLSDHMIRKLHDELKTQGLLRLVDNQKLKVVDIENELEVRRLKKGDN